MKKIVVVPALLAALASLAAAQNASIGESVVVRG